MGSPQSKPAREWNVQQDEKSEKKKADLERLFHTRDHDDGHDGHDGAGPLGGEGYVHVVKKGDHPQQQPREAATASMDVGKAWEPQGLEASVVEQWQNTLLSDPKNRLAMLALSDHDPRAVLTSRRARIADQQVFNVKIPLEGSPVTDQGSSGRCWLFASTNVFRVALMRKYGLEAFELSQAYLFFWDKLEKSNWFLEQAIATAGLPEQGRAVQHLLAEPLSDGGQWDMVFNLVRKYGLVPKPLYPDGFSAGHSAVLNAVLLSRLRGHALALRAMVAGAKQHRDGGDDDDVVAMLAAAKAKMMKEVHAVLAIALGTPPPSDRPFEWEFVDKSGKARTVRMTPKAFAADIYTPSFGVSMNTIASMVSLVHDPRHPPLTLLTVDRLGNVVGGRGVTYVNVSMATLKAACVAMLRAGQPVFFGSDVGKFSDSRAGVMDVDLYDYALGLDGVSPLGGSGEGDGNGPGVLDKAARLRAGDSQMTHAMVLTAVHVVDDDDGGNDGGKRKEGGGDGGGGGGKKERSVRWRVQNSWGAEAGDKGWFVMSDRWMDEFVFQAVVDPRFLAKEVRDVLKKEPVVLPAWDPMGSLA